MYISPVRGGDWPMLPHDPLLVSEGVAEMASVTVRTDNAGEDHPADLGLVAWVANNWTELLNAVSKLALVPIRARTCLLPFVAQLCLDHALLVHLQFKRLLILILFLCSAHAHLLLYMIITHRQSLTKILR